MASVRWISGDDPAPACVTYPGWKAHAGGLGVPAICLAFDADAQGRGDWLHQTGEHPISQFLSYDKDTQQMVWTVNLLCTELETRLSPPLLETNLSLTSTAVPFP